ncbi:AAA family ATPase, partial [Ralstonia pseudosolanacearum]|uniref:AAA family ATPase n=1 Tax=Ralstonia pseudosolanacearum TaxID=1310165 RepID=UPI003CFBAEF5
MGGDYHISPPNRNILLEKLPAPANYADLKAVTANQIAAGLTLMLFEAVRTDIKKDYNEVCYHHLGAEGFFVGRDSELNQIADYFSNNGRVLVLYGLDGMGKSALARHYAWRATLSYDIVWWINASTKQSVLESYSTFLDQLPAISKTLGKKKKI